LAKRPLAWGDTIFDQALVASQVNLNLLTDLAPSDTITAARLVGHLYFTTDDVLNVVDGAMAVSCGVQVVTVRADAIGGSAVPNPSISAEVPARGWLWRDRGIVINAVGPGPVDFHFVSELKFDIRTMRKVDRGVLLLSLFPEGIHGTTFNTKVTGIMRVLCMT